MLKKQELTDPTSCLNKAASNERIFVLRENDPLFAQTVRHWATMAEGVHEDAKIKEARATADAAEKNKRERAMPELAADSWCNVVGCTNRAERNSRTCTIHHD